MILYGQTTSTNPPDGNTYAGGSAGSVVWNRFVGPGRVGLQSMYLHMPTTE